MTPEEIAAVRKRFGIAEPVREISQQGFPVDAAESASRVRRDAILRQVAKGNAENAAYDSLRPPRKIVDAARESIANINKDAKKVSIQRTQFYDGRERGYSSLEPSYSDAERAKVQEANQKISSNMKKISGIHQKIEKIRASIPNKAMGIAADALFAERYANADAYDEAGGLYRKWDTTELEGQTFTTQSVQDMMNRAALIDAEYEQNKGFNIEAAKLREEIRRNPSLVEDFSKRYLK